MIPMSNFQIHELEQIEAALAEQDAAEHNILDAQRRIDRLTFWMVVCFVVGAFLMGVFLGRCL